MSEKIESLNQLKKLAELKCSVIVPKSPCWNKHKPASFILRLQGELILKLFESGMYVYQPKKIKLKLKKGNSLCEHFRKLKAYKKNEN